MARLTHPIAFAFFAASLFGLLFQSAARAADEGLSFKGKTIRMIIGYDTGGGTDAAGRLAASFLSKYLPGQPTIIVSNMPGAEGTTALNYMIQQTKPDGLTVATGAAAQVDPLNFRKPNIVYDPAKIIYIGGMGRGGSVLIINAAAEPRLYDKSLAPVVMGSNSSMPRQDMQVTLWCVEYLGWNVKWVVGYPGTNEVMLALDRGEVDMTSTANVFQIQKLLDAGRYRILNQSGTMKNGAIVPSPDFGKAPLFPDEVRDKLSDATAQKAFIYWNALNSVDKWLGLAPGTPPAIAAAYKQAYAAVAADPDFVAQGKRISQDFRPQSAADIELIVSNLVDTPNAAIDYTKVLMRKQGIRVD